MGYHQVFEKKTRALNIVRFEQLKRTSLVKAALRVVLLRTVVGSESVAQVKKVHHLMQFGALSRFTRASRLVSCCSRTGRSHMVLRKQTLSRMVFREYAHRGVLPFMVKGS